MTILSEKNKELQQVEQLENARSILLIDDTPAIHDDIRKICLLYTSPSPRDSR